MNTDLDKHIFEIKVRINALESLKKEIDCLVLTHKKKLQELKEN